MASQDYYDSGESDNSSDSNMDTEDNKEQSDTPEEKMGLVPLSFFSSKDVKPGDKEEVEVMSIHEGEAVIKCVYKGDKESKDEDQMEAGEEPSDTSAPSEAQDAMSY